MTQQGPPHPDPPPYAAPRPTSEPPDFESIARKLAEYLVDEDDIRIVTEQLRQVWNARGAAADQRDLLMVTINLGSRRDGESPVESIGRWQRDSAALTALRERLRDRRDQWTEEVAYQESEAIGAQTDKRMTIATTLRLCADQLTKLLQILPR